jgi:DnaJ-class molecular chaperone
MKERYNKHLKRIISLNEGERFCPNCDGSGTIRAKWHNNNYGNSTLLLVCSNCLGQGKLDWIEEAVGKRVVQNAKT